MKYLKSYSKLFDNYYSYKSPNDLEDESGQISINEFVNKIGIDRKDEIIKWWNENRNHIKLHIKSFNTRQPIAGIFLGSDMVYINGNLPPMMPPYIKLFLALHESRHCDQHRDGRFMSGYYDTVLNGDKEGFLSSYKELEKDANDYAFNAMRELGYQMREEHMLRENENSGQMVYNMMSDDIKKFNLGPDSDFFDLLKKQVNI